MILKKANILFIAVGTASFSFNLFADTTPLNLWAEKKLTPEQQLGKAIFFDDNLSSPAGQACASCHDIKTSLTDTSLESPVSLGAVSGKTGSRNTPSAAYSAFSPQFHFNPEEGLYVGGQFLDGRAADLREQAKAPFLNPDEMNNKDEQTVIDKIRSSNYSTLFKQVFGENIFNETDTAYNKMAQAVAAYENTTVFNRFTSKYDFFLAGRVALSKQEQLGLELFEDEKKGNCAACHISRTDSGSPPLFTDFTYDNIGVPSNPQILALKGPDFVDLGLGATINNAGENGKFKVPSLRNVAKTAPYMHNGVFVELKEVVDFYNTRDTDSNWGAPEVAENVNTDELGDLKLTTEEANALVAFMRTLTDGYQLQDKPRYSAISGTLTVPFVRTEGINRIDKFYSARLQQNGSGNFKLAPLNEVSITDYSQVETMPYYSFDTELFELPEVIVSDGANGIVSYTVQLKLEQTETNDTIFKLSYAKILQ